MSMQFYLDGYRPGDPRVQPAPASVADRPAGVPDEVDVLIVGCGPAGLVLAAQLAHFPDIVTAVIDASDGPLQVGRADGVACRTVEMFEAFGLADQLIGEGYWVNEVSFWQPDPADRSRITRTGHVRDTEEGLSEFPHVIVNQARMLAYLRERMERSAGRVRPQYSLRVSDVALDADPDATHPARVTLTHADADSDSDGKDQVSTVRAKYVVGCDGARSAVRSAIGQQLIGDETNHSWGVMDVLAVTDFPDIRRKCTVHSAAEGNILIIPREGGYLVRLYIELDAVRDGEMLAARAVTPEALTEVARRILHPYTLEVRDIGWWSVYHIGQRLCDAFDDVPVDAREAREPHVFIAGDACHTHSAKAGQGMNVSMADTWNLGWKLASVLQGIARPELLHTYTAERRQVAQELIDFDREFARLFSSGSHDSESSEPAADAGGDPEEFQRYFVQQGRFTAGVAVRYEPSMITGDDKYQGLAARYQVGTRFHSAPVIRSADARPLQLGHVARADGAWRLYAFADPAGLGDPDSGISGLCRFLASEASPRALYTPRHADPDAVIDVRAIVQQPLHELDPASIPAVLRPRKGPFALIDYEKVFNPDLDAGDIFELRGIDRSQGCLVIVRPDQYVAHVLPLDAHRELADFFAGIFRLVAP